MTTYVHQRQEERGNNKREKDSEERGREGRRSGVGEEERKHGEKIEQVSGKGC